MTPLRCLSAVLFSWLLLGLPAAVADDPDLQSMRDAWQRGELKDALVQLKGRVTEQPNDVDALRVLASVYLDLFQGAEAEQTLVAGASGGDAARTRRVAVAARVADAGQVSAPARRDRDRVVFRP